MAGACVARALLEEVEDKRSPAARSSGRRIESRLTSYSNIGRTLDHRRHHRLVVAALFWGNPILWTIGVILVVLGVLFWILGAIGRAVRGRAPYYEGRAAEPPLATISGLPSGAGGSASQTASKETRIVAFRLRSTRSRPGRPVKPAGLRDVSQSHQPHQRGGQMNTRPSGRCRTMTLLRASSAHDRSSDRGLSTRTELTMILLRQVAAASNSARKHSARDVTHSDRKRRRCPMQNETGPLMLDARSILRRAEREGRDLTAAERREFDETARQGSRPQVSRERAT